MGRITLALVGLLMAACSMAVGADGAAPARPVIERVAAAPTASHPAGAVGSSAQARVNAAAARRAPTPAVETPLRTAFARVGSVTLVHPADRVARVGFHQASDVRNRDLAPARSAVRPTVLPSRGRATSRRSAADIVVHPDAAIRAPVSGIVKRARGYRLYCKHHDAFAVISPDGHPEIEVKILHISGLRVRPGDRVVAGKTVIAQHATKFPFRSQIDAFTAGMAWPHVHIEVTQLAVPSAMPELGKSLTFGCA